MRNKENILKNLDQLRNDISSVRYIVNTTGNFQEISEAFAKTFDRLENLEGLIAIEPDDFRTTQII